MRAEIEAIISQGVQAFDLRRSRYFGFAKTHLQHIATAAAMNVLRIVLLGQWRPYGTDKAFTLPAPDPSASSQMMSSTVSKARKYSEWLIRISEMRWIEASPRQ